MRITAAALSILLFVMPSCQESFEQTFSQHYNPAYLTQLLTLAKAAIREQFDTQRFSAFQEIPYSRNQLGMFIRIINNGKDRGCVGFYRGVDSIEYAVRAAAVNAAFFDGRYPPLSREELKSCELEITVIGELMPMKDPFNFDIDKHMLRIEFDNHEAMLQPQIAAQYGYDKQALLRALCRKAGLDEDAFRDASARLFKVRAIFLRMQWADLH
jgi:AmmeMemoRadiSam system protein A